MCGGIGSGSGWGVGGVAGDKSIYRANDKTCGCCCCCWCVVTDEKTKDVQLTGKTPRYKDARTSESARLFYGASPGLHLLSTLFSPFSFFFVFCAERNERRVSEHALFKKQTCRLDGILTTHAHFMSHCSYLGEERGRRKRRRRRGEEEGKQEEMYRRGWINPPG